MSFTQQYNQIKSLANDELKIIEQNLIAQINTKEPLNSSIKNFLTTPSKRVRPLLAILYIKANNETLSNEQLNLLSVIELIHNASLIHDDIIDECNVRRGEKTLSAKFDNKMGVITGDYLLAIAMQKLTEIGNVEIIKKISQTIQNMCIGEINQNFERFKIGTIENYIEKTKNKTAYLFETALVCTALLSKNSYNIKNISDFGIETGIAFQIRDDILNFTDTDSSKPHHNDIQEGIFNAPAILGESSDNYITGIEKTKVLLNNYIESAAAKMCNLPENQYKIALNKFLELLKHV